MNIPSPRDTGQINTNSVQGPEFAYGKGASSSSLPSSPRIWAQRLRGNRLHVKWETSPVNPHLMNYCLVVNTRKDYSSLCSASGERFGVLPPDLMHVTYYGGQNRESLHMVDNNNGGGSWKNLSHVQSYFGVSLEFSIIRNQTLILLN